MKKVLNTLLLLVTLFLVGCQTATPKYDYSNFNRSNPKSILVLPPINETAEIKASNAFLSTITHPLAEKGFYVFPVALTREHMVTNGLHTPGDMHAAPMNKLREVFGADAALYVNIKTWATKYMVLTTITQVKMSYRLMDLRTGALLWSSEINHSIDSNPNNQGGSAEAQLVAALVSAAVKKVSSAMVDYETPVARQANQIAINHPNLGLPNGPRRPTEK